MAELSNAALMFTSMLRQRGDLKCYICGEGSRADDPWEAEHRQAKNGALRGAHNESNVSHAHRSCNRIKGVQSL